jgi:hypothetical protein
LMRLVFSSIAARVVPVDENTIRTQEMRTNEVASSSRFQLVDDFRRS